MKFEELPECAQGIALQALNDFIVQYPVHEKEPAPARQDSVDHIINFAQRSLGALSERLEPAMINSKLSHSEIITELDSLADSLLYIASKILDSRRDLINEKTGSHGYLRLKAEALMEECRINRFNGISHKAE